MRYSELYDEGFLSNFNMQQRHVLDKMALGEEDYEIYIQKLVNKLGVAVETDSSDPMSVRKYVMAYELGQTILPPPSEPFYRFVNPDNYESLMEKSRERQLAKFAINLLMPAKLVDLAVESVSKDTPEKLDSLELAKLVAKKMNLPFGLVSSRLQNLGIIL